MEKVRVVIADDQAPARRGLMAMLDLCPAVEVIGEAADGEEAVHGVPLAIHVILVIPIITSVLSLAFLALTMIAWKRGEWSLVSWLYYSLIALASVLFVLFAGYWNLLGWRF